jgi:hypothetical protein
MGLLRRLASLLGRMFQRIARALLSWSRGSGERELWPEGPDDGPPEHWLRYVRQRAPWLVGGRRTGSAGEAREAARTAAAPEERRPQPPNPQPPHARRAPPRMVLPGPPAPQAGAGPPEQEAPGSPAEPPRASAPGPAAERAARGAVLSKVVLPGTPRETAPVERAPSAARWAAAREPAAGAKRGGEPRERREENLPRAFDRSTEPRVEWPRLSPAMALDTPAARAQDGEAAGVRSGAGAEGAEPLGERGFPASSPAAGAGPAARAAAPAEPSENARWPELPEMRWRGEAWQVPSSRALVKEQLRLTRLLAEQAGSSWSGPPS